MCLLRTGISSGRIRSPQVLQDDVSPSLRSGRCPTYCLETLKPLLPADMSTFVDYYEYTWIRSSHRKHIFSNNRWNQHDATALLLPRSSNIAEGWHHGFNSMLSCSNPTIWKFLHCLKKEQDLDDVKITKMLMQEAPEPRAAKWRKYDECLQRIITNFHEYSSVIDYLKC